MTTEIKTKEWENWVRKDWQNEWKHGCNIYTLGDVAIETNKVWRAEKREWIDKKTEIKYVLVKYREIWSNETDENGEAISVKVEIEEMREYKSRNALMNALRRK